MQCNIDLRPGGRAKAPAKADRSSSPFLLANWRANAASPRGARERPLSLLARLEHGLWQAQQRDLGLRLAAGVDVADVERVLRHVGRILPHHRYD